jgi:myo-inositol-1(or 4)-monophosphatase
MGANYLEMTSQLEMLVRQVADEVIVPQFTSRDFAEQIKLDGSVLTEVDKNVQDQIEAKLNALWPEIAFLGEEMSIEKQQELLHSKAVWCLDPIDGTSNFASGIPFYAVSLALVENQEAVLGLIYDPMRKECFTAVKGEGCWLNGIELSNGNSGDGELQLDEMIAVVDLKRLEKSMLGTICRGHPFRSQRNFGSCALEWCWLAAGRVQLYIHGGQKQWDYAAGVLILKEAGGVASTIEGEEVFSQKLEPRSVIAGCDEMSYKKWKAWIDENN